MDDIPNDLIVKVFDFVSSNRDRNSISLVCKSWYRIEKYSRRSVSVYCYTVSPDLVIKRFPNLQSLTIKGMFHSVPDRWGCYLEPWIEVLLVHGVKLQELTLKRMVFHNGSLELLSKFTKLKVLNLVRCTGFDSEGLASIAANCRYISQVNLQDSDLNDFAFESPWLNYFPESCTSLTSLDFSCVNAKLDMVALEMLVARSPELKRLKLSSQVPFGTLTRIMSSAPQLVELGVGSLIDEPDSEPESYMRFLSAIKKCTSLRSLSGFCASPQFLAFYPLCHNLISLDLSLAQRIEDINLIRLIPACKKLQKLCILDYIGDKGLEVVAASCKELQELSVLPAPLYNGKYAVTEVGLVAISAGCPDIHSVIYNCRGMTNAGLLTVAENCRNFIRFSLCILEPRQPDTSKSLDQGLGRIVQECTRLRRLSLSGLSGLVTDTFYIDIGLFAKNLEKLSLDSTGVTNKGIAHIVNGCKSLKRLEIVNSASGDIGVLAGLGNYENMRCMWMSLCDLTVGGCKKLARNLPFLNVEIIGEGEDDEVEWNEEQKVYQLYVYRSVVGPRKDAPDYIRIL